MLTWIMNLAYLWKLLYLSFHYIDELFLIFSPVFRYVHWAAYELV